MYILVIGHEGDAEPVLDAGYYGPFEDMPEAQEYARTWRSLVGLPSDNAKPTAEENEAWTEAGFTFEIFQLKRGISVIERMKNVRGRSTQ